MPLKDISAVTNAPISTCPRIIQLSKAGCAENCRAENPNAPVAPDADENINPNPTCKKGDNQILSIAQKQTLIELAVKDATHC